MLINCGTLRLWMSLTMFLVDCVAHGLVMDRAVLLGHGGTLLAVDGGAGLSVNKLTDILTFWFIETSAVLPVFSCNFD